MTRMLCLVAATMLMLGITGGANARGRLLPRLFPRLCRPVETPCLPVSQPTAIPSRNMVNLVERNLPTSWSVEEGKFKNIKWSADLRHQSFGTPVVSNGRVFVASSNQKRKERSFVALMFAFRESDGKLLWQNTHDHPTDYSSNWAIRGVPSTPTIDADRIYYIAPACEVICADSATGKIHWRYDMDKELKVYASDGTFWSTPPLGAPLVLGDLVFVITGNGIDFSDGNFKDSKLRSPKAPSFVALHKKTGKLAWKSSLPGENIIEGQWSSATCASVNGVPQVIFAGGDSVIYSFEPATGKLLWKCDCLPTRKKKGDGIDNYFLGAPVVVGTKLYVGMGVTSAHVQTPSWSYFLCLDVTKSGDVSPKSYDAKAPANKNSALVWAFGGPILPAPAKGRQAYFGSTMSTAAVHDGLVYISEETGYLHCLDANTGQRYWEHDLKDSVWGSPYWADGKVYLGTLSGEILVFAHGKTKKLIATIEMDDNVETTPVAANGVLYVLTKSKLYAIGSR